MKGQVIRSINNIYSIKTSDNADFLCRIKGKVLSSCAGEYNPVIVGDYVEFNVSGEGEGLILERLDRKTTFTRWNAKVQKNQTLAANMDMVVAVCSVANPPFRPRFIDRVLCCARNVPVLIVLNKNDIELDETSKNRFQLFEDLGYEIVRVSAKSGKGIENLKNKLIGKTVAFVGQSGVGKSSIINLLCPSSSQKIGIVSKKYDRGRHTTNHSIMIEESDYKIIDTPGVREIAVPHDDPLLIAHSFPEFIEPMKKCSFSTCLHLYEPDCEVKRLVENGQISEDRYESYVNMIEGLSEKAPTWGRNEKKNK